MQLLVSVRSASEVEAALAGGADIIDAKEPSHGSLGAVSTATLVEMLAQLPSSRAFSLACGDVGSPNDVLASLGGLRFPPRQAPVYMKLGFAGIDSPELVSSLLDHAVEFAARHPAKPRVIAVAYGDGGRAKTLAPELLSNLAASAGAAGVLVDTYVKDGSSLLDWVAPAALKTWVSETRMAGLLTALAGALSLNDIDTVAAAAPDVIGVRGAACYGGRTGRVSAELVERLRRQLDDSAAVAFPGP